MAKFFRIQNHLDIWCAFNVEQIQCIYAREAGSQNKPMHLPKRYQPCLKLLDGSEYICGGEFAEVTRSLQECVR